MTNDTWMLLLRLPPERLAIAGCFSLRTAPSPLSSTPLPGSAPGIGVVPISNIVTNRAAEPPEPTP